MCNYSTYYIALRLDAELFIPFFLQDPVGLLPLCTYGSQALRNEYILSIMQQLGLSSPFWRQKGKKRGGKKNNKGNKAFHVESRKISDLKLGAAKCQAEVTDWFSSLVFSPCRGFGPSFPCLLFPPGAVGGQQVFPCPEKFLFHLQAPLFPPLNSPSRSPVL